MTQKVPQSGSHRNCQPLFRSIRVSAIVAVSLTSAHTLAALLSLHRGASYMPLAKGFDSLPPLPQRENSGAASNLRFHSPPEGSKISLLEGGDEGALERIDAFSATWWQSVERFLKQDLEAIDGVEDGCFEMFWNTFEEVRMTFDWLDFSVEHMSKWWGAMFVLDQDDPTMLITIARRFKDYARNIWLEISDRGEAGTTVTNSTIVVIPFLPYLSEKNPSRGRELTVASLAATLASLLRAGMGRVVVFGYYEDDAQLVQKAFRFLRDGVCGTSGNQTLESLPVSRIGPMEVNYIRAKNPPFTNMDDPDINMPKGALISLRRAFLDSHNQRRRDLWLGGPRRTSRWKYVYLTEPDTILQARPSALQVLGHTLDKGLIVVPHRLQPVPHESDVNGTEVDRNRVLPSVGHFRKVFSLDVVGDSDACCDDGVDKPGMPPAFPKCGTFWWLCGFDSEEEDTGYRDPFQRHKRFMPYQLMRLQGGTGFVSLAGTEHGRRCMPMKKYECHPPEFF